MFKGNEGPNRLKQTVFQNNLGRDLSLTHPEFVRGCGGGSSTLSHSPGIAV